ncbi:MAG TPA: hypothetical protein PJ982_10410 [Lacipirellulaceae bacterium]|nr:hypothetical protein [Lacipirellulaceae bacterium]
MNPNRIALVAGALLVLLVGAWWMGWLSRDDDGLAEIRQLAAQPQTRENARALRDMVGERMQGLDEQQRFQMFEQMAPVFIPLMAARFEQEYDRFMAMTPEEQNRELDRRIDEMQRRGGPRTGAATQPNIDPQKMDSFRKKMLDWVSPEQRGKFQNGIQIFNNRLQQRGMPPVSPPGGSFF